jgi:hypothetical protein
MAGFHFPVRHGKRLIEGGAPGKASHAETVQPGHGTGATRTAVNDFDLNLAGKHGGIVAQDSSFKSCGFSRYSTALKCRKSKGRDLRYTLRFSPGIGREKGRPIIARPHLAAEAGGVRVWDALLSTIRAE